MRGSKTQTSEIPVKQGKMQQDQKAQLGPNMTIEQGQRINGSIFMQPHPPRNFSIRAPLVHTSLVAQCSATGVTVAGTPPCSAIRFRTQKCRDTLHQPAATLPPPPTPCLLRMRQENATGGSGERCDTLIRGGVARFWRDISDLGGHEQWHILPHNSC